MNKIASIINSFCFACCGTHTKTTTTNSQGIYEALNHDSIRMMQDSRIRFDMDSVKKIYGNRFIEGISSINATPSDLIQVVVHITRTNRRRKL